MRLLFTLLCCGILASLMANTNNTTFTSGGGASIVITEISYNPPESGQDSLEYIELYNAGPVATDLTGWTFTGVDFVFPEFTLAEDAYVIIAVNESAFRNVFNYTGDAYQWTDGALSNGGETITLFDANGTTVDMVAFGDDAPWPTSVQGTDGGGASIVLCDPASDNNSGASWQAASTPTGVTINGNEVLGNPGAASDCGDVAPTCYFEQTNDNVQEGDGIITYAIIAQNYPASSTIELSFVDEGMDAVIIGSDVSSTPELPATFTTTGEPAETFTFDLTIIDDAEVEMEEIFRATLVPSEGEFVGEDLRVIVRDNDTEVTVVPINTINGIDANGVALSLEETVTVQGVVHCIDYRGGEGLQFWIIETDTGDGINIFTFNDVDGYVVTEGDLIQVTGEVDQFNGLTEIIPTDIEVLSQDNAIVVPAEVSTLDESTESKYVTLVGHELVGGDEAIIRAGGGWNAIVASGTDTITVRVEDEINVDSMFLAEYFGPTIPGTILEITGIASQRDQSDPLLGDYQLLPCGEGSFDFLTAVNEPTWAADLLLFPNPTKDQLNVWAGIDLEAYQLVDMQGRLLQTGQVNTPSLTIDMEQLPSGMYQLQLIRAGEVVNRSVIKQ